MNCDLFHSRSHRNFYFSSNDGYSHKKSCECPKAGLSKQVKNSQLEWCMGSNYKEGGVWRL